MKDTLLNDLHQTGYDQEEEYFYRLNHELIELIHQRHAAEEARRAEEASQEGGDAAESESAAFASAVKRLLHKAVEPLPSGIGQFPV
jgi:hypothetical protein